MANFEEILKAARTLSRADQERLARALAPPPAAVGRAPELAMANLAAPRPHSVAWVKAERGHAVLATETPESEADIPAGATAIAGLWSDRGEMADGAAWVQARRSGEGS
jgi:hypothetical protein